MPVKISALPSLGTMTDAAIIPVVASSTTSQITGANLKTYFSSVTGNITGGNINTGGVVSATGNNTGANFVSGSNVAVLSNVARYTWVSNVAPTAGQGSVGDIWYQTV